MSYDKFEASFTKENKSLKVLLVTNVAVAILLTVSLYFQRRYFIYKGGPIMEERPLAEEICRQGLVGLAEGSPNPYLVSQGIIDLVNSDPFDLKIDKIYQVQSLEKGACKIVLQSEGKLLAFKIILAGSNLNPFYYKLLQLDEIPAKEKEE